MIPRTLAAAQRLPLLTPEQLTPTKWNNADDKAKFGNLLLRFIAEDFPPGLWRKPFYERLSNSFSNIAHYDIHGFWETWFTTTADQIEFLDNIARHHCFGDAGFTFSDVERIVKTRVKNAGIIAWKQRVLHDETRQRDLNELARLRRLYEHSAPSDTQIPPLKPSIMVPASQRQTDLFGTASD